MAGIINISRGYGYETIIEPGKATLEADTFTCCHCNGIVSVRPFAPASEAGGWCARCAKPICGPCADKGTCRPFEKWLDEVEKKARIVTLIR